MKENSKDASFVSKLGGCTMDMTAFVWSVRIIYSNRNNPKKRNDHYFIQPLNNTSTISSFHSFLFSLFDCDKFRVIIE
jgi:hypothetical protein